MLQSYKSSELTAIRDTMTELRLRWAFIVKQRDWFILYPYAFPGSVPLSLGMIDAELEKKFNKKFGSKENPLKFA
jgi:hypothetical protein